MRTIYVTFQIKEPPYLFAPTIVTKHYAIKCGNMNDAKEAAADIYSFDGVSYVYINKCGRLRHKDTKVILFGSNYGKEL